MQTIIRPYCKVLRMKLFFSISTNCVEWGRCRKMNKTRKRKPEEKKIKKHRDANNHSFYFKFIYLAFLIYNFLFLHCAILQAPSERANTSRLYARVTRLLGSRLRSTFCDSFKKKRGWILLAGINAYPTCLLYLSRTAYGSVIRHQKKYSWASIRRRVSKLARAFRDSPISGVPGDTDNRY